MGWKRPVAAGLLGLTLVALGIGGIGWWASQRSEPVVEYVVVRGDTLGEIATRYGVTVPELREWNGIEGDLIEVGQVLIVRTTSAPAPTEARPRRPRRRVSGTVERAAPDGNEPPPLTLPEPLDCLGGPTLDDARDEAMAASEGLSHSQVSGAMNAFLGNTLRCLPSGEDLPSEPLLMEITVGCDGRVTQVAVVDAGDWDRARAACVTDVISYTPFPAHALPDGEVFQFPLQVTPPT